jgi:hypothetical protein
VFLPVDAHLTQSVRFEAKWQQCNLEKNSKARSMSVTVPDSKTSDQNSPATTAAPVPKRITNAQTVCNERNEKGKLCNGHLKQLRTAGEPAEVHLRGDDVLSKCQTCGTFYMGPPLGHVRDPQKQSRFVEAELTALLQAAGGTMPIIRKDERGVYVMVESAGEQSHAPKSVATATAAPPKASTAATVKPAPSPAAPKTTAEHKAGAEPNRQLFKRSTYAGVTDTGPVAGETFEQKVARLKALAGGAKQRAEEGGEPTAPSGPAPTPAQTPVAAAPLPPESSAPASTASKASTTHKPTGNADRTLMKRFTYSGVVDTGPVAGETFEQKVARLAALSAAAKQRSEEG